MPYLDILYQDEDLIAVHKPAGLLVHPSWIAPKMTPNLVYSLKTYFRGAPVHTIHRLDRATSGVIVFAKNKHTAQQMNAQFAERKVKKTYLCVTRGYTPEEGVIDYALKPIFDKMADPFSDPDKPPKEAVSAYRRLGTVELPIEIGKYPCARYSLVEVKPTTGRKHQIRRHMKHILHPLIGDTNYGEGRHNRLFREHLDTRRMLLMATELTFEHPGTGEVLTIKAPVTHKVATLFDRLGWQGLYPAFVPKSQEAVLEALAGEVEQMDGENSEE
ncbi:pseudouridine synthase [Neptunomonas antarctica]|uniref:tRNA pseudouridine synthase C n=2 Tax=Neptunomonas antarctica TaxID=619304 RepID=A0A1N7PIU4_9GAMM|nr:pseudouridine synthase [Neptunomonas antarctica]SIT10545.1 tRNA pseudouridine synthase C [Neptunomonas antarctica]